MSFGAYVPEPKMAGIDFALSDLRHWHRVEIVCAHCHHRSWLNVEATRQKLGDGVLSSDVAAKARCARCRRLGGHRVTLCRQSRD